MAQAAQKTLGVGESHEAHEGGLRKSPRSRFHMGGSSNHAHERLLASPPPLFPFLAGEAEEDMVFPLAGNR